MPRPGRILRPIETPNVWDHDADLPSNDMSVGADPTENGWDVPDYIEAIGIGLLAIGLILSLIPATRSGGWLFPIGAAAVAGAAYAARRKDETEA